MNKSTYEKQTYLLYIVFTLQQFTPCIEFTINRIIIVINSLIMIYPIWHLYQNISPVRNHFHGPQLLNV